MKCFHCQREVSSGGGIDFSGFKSGSHDSAVLHASAPQGNIALTQSISLMWRVVNLKDLPDNLPMKFSNVWTEATVRCHISLSNNNSINNNNNDNNNITNNNNSCWQYIAVGLPHENLFERILLYMHSPHKTFSIYGALEIPGHAAVHEGYKSKCFQNVDRKASGHTVTQFGVGFVGRESKSLRLYSFFLPKPFGCLKDDRS